MSKNKGIVIAIIAIVGLIAAGSFFMSKQKAAGTASNSSPEQKASSSASPTPASPVAIDSIKDIFSKQMSVECTITDDKGNKSVLHIKNGAMATTTKDASMIMKDKKVYMWQTGRTEGFSMTIDPEELVKTANAANKKDASKPGAPFSADDFMKEVNNFKQNCKTAVVPDSLFVPPANVKFTSFDGLMNLQKQIPNVSMPADIQKMMDGAQKAN